MTEVLFIVTTIFVAYVLYVVVSEQKSTSNSEEQPAKVEKPAAAVKQSTSQPAPKKEKVANPKPAAAVVSKPVPAEPKAAAAKPVAATTSKPAPTPSAAVAPETGKRGLKDPKTGEVATTYSNYRFTKRWIKEALVAEGLLDKVYKNDELNAAIEANIKTALSKLEAIKKYQA